MMHKTKTLKISGTGCTLVDYLYKPVHFDSTDFAIYLSKNAGDGGLSPGKLVFSDEFEKFSGEEYSGARNKITGGQSPVAVNIGGPSIVSLIHASQLLHGLPVEIGFCAARGNDEGGVFIEKMLAKTPLGKGRFKIAEKYTPFTDVLSDPDFDGGQGERIFINNIGAAWELLPDDLDESFFAADMVVFGGTALVPNIHKNLGSLLKKAKQNEAITVVNTVYDFLNEKKNPSEPWPLGETSETFKSIDLLLSDMEEALRISGKNNVDEALLYFKKMGVGAAVITHGANELHYYSAGRLFGNIQKSSLPVSEKVKSELLRGLGKNGDTTGCGDNFVGGVIASVAGQLMGKPHARPDLKQAIALGVASGGFACFYNGGTYYEKSVGQKAELVRGYYQNYIEQIGINANA